MVFERDEFPPAFARPMHAVLGARDREPVAVGSLVDLNVLDQGLQLLRHAQTTNFTSVVLYSEDLQQVLHGPPCWYSH